MPMIPPSRAGPLRDNGSHSYRGEGKHMQPLLMDAAGRAARYLDGLPTRRVSPSSSDVEGLEGFFHPPPAALAANVLAGAWDQNAGLEVSSPVAAALEKVCRDWLISALGLPSDAEVGFATGATMANFTGFLAGRGAPAPAP